MQRERVKQPTGLSRLGCWGFPHLRCERPGCRAQAENHGRRAVGCSNVGQGSIGLVYADGWAAKAASQGLMDSVWLESRNSYPGEHAFDSISGAKYRLRAR